MNGTLIDTKNQGQDCSDEATLVESGIMKTVFIMVTAAPVLVISFILLITLSFYPHIAHYSSSNAINSG